MRKYLRFLFKNKIVNKIIGFVIPVLLYTYLRIILLTSKVVIEGDTSLIDNSNDDSISNTSNILCFWHGRGLSSFILLKSFKYMGQAGAIVSKGGDGDIMTRFAKFEGVEVIRGSTSTSNKDKGGASALKSMISFLKKPKHTIAIAPDGPIGPRMRVGSGLVTLALISKKPIIPLAISAKRFMLAKSWDRYLIILPFSKIKLKIAPKIDSVLSDGTKKDKEKLRLEVEEALNKITHEVDEEMGVPYIEPLDVDKKGNTIKRKNS